MQGCLYRTCRQAPRGDWRKQHTEQQKWCILMSGLTTLYDMQACPRGDWKKQYGEQQKVQARVLYVDATSKKIMLSLQPELSSLSMRPLPSIGEVFEVCLLRPFAAPLSSNCACCSLNRSVKAAPGLSDIRHSLAVTGAAA